MATIFGPVEANASVHQLDQRQLDEIIMPDLQDMANNHELLERVRERRFNRDEPPPYRSPSPDDHDHDHDAIVPWLTSSRANIIAEIEELIRPPLDEKELRVTQENFEAWNHAYNPGRRYEQEAFWDSVIMKHDPGVADPKIRKMLSGPGGQRRQKVFIRHRIRKRWERLGVWNPEWGIPGRVHEGPRDKTSFWKWRWQGDTPDRGAEREPYLPQHPNSRAVQLREGLRRGERGPLPPRSSLTADASKSAAESFITSRPWYTFELDCEEERTRLNRIPYSKQRFYDMRQEKHVAARWVEAGDLMPWGDSAGWKWKHESPSPEPENLSNMDLTPSEIDALEDVPATPPPPPRRKCRRVIVPGTEHQVIPRFEEVFSPEPEALVPEAEATQLCEELGEDVANAPSPPQQKPNRGRPKGRKAKPTPGDEPDPSEAPGPRRSARIVERAGRLGVAAAQTDPVKTTHPRKDVPHKPKNPRAISTAGAGSVSPAPKRGRGRPPKAIPSKASEPQGIVKKRGRPRKKT